MTRAIVKDLCLSCFQSRDVSPLRFHIEIRTGANHVCVGFVCGSCLITKPYIFRQYHTGKTT